MDECGQDETAHDGSNQGGGFQSQQLQLHDYHKDEEFVQDVCLSKTKMKLATMSFFIVFSTWMMLGCSSLGQAGSQAPSYCRCLSEPLRTTGVAAGRPVPLYSLVDDLTDSPPNNLVILQFFT